MIKQSRLKRTAEPKPLTAAQQHRQAMRTAVDRVCDAWPDALLDVGAIGFPGRAGYDGGSGGGPTLRVQVGDHEERVSATGVELAALTGHDIGYAVGWISELHDTVLAILAAAYPTAHVQVEWQPDPVRAQLLAAVSVLADSWDAHRPGHDHQRGLLYRLADSAARHWPGPPSKGTSMGGVTVGQRTPASETCGLCEKPVAGGRDDPIRRIDGQAFHAKSCWFTVTRQRQAKAS
jgi:hypothetical protein